MKKFHDNLGKVLGFIFGYGIMIVTFAGGGTFFGYLAALVIGGEKAAIICDVIYNTVIPVIVKATSILIITGLCTMYLYGQTALTVGKEE